MVGVGVFCDWFVGDNVCGPQVCVGPEGVCLL